MQVFIPQRNTIFVPILKNASNALTQALVRQYPDYILVNPSYAARRAVMWRNPVQRIESTYCFMCDQGMDAPFAKWVTAVCEDGLREPHLQPQVEFCANPQEIFFWDFDGFARFFGLKRRQITVMNESRSYPTEWDERAKAAFHKAYARDLRVWSIYNAQAFWPEAGCASKQEDESDVSGSEVCLGSSQIDSPGSERHRHEGGGQTENEI